MSISIQNLKKTLIETFNEVVKYGVELLPNALAAIALLIMGWFLAHMAKLLIRKIFNWLDRIFAKQIQDTNTPHSRRRSVYAGIIERVMFWGIILFFIAAAGNVLGIKIFSDLVKNSFQYLPNLISGTLIVLLGFFMGNVTKAAIINTDTSFNEDSNALIAQIVQFLVIFSAIIIGVEQIGLNVQLLSNFLILSVGILLAGTSLAFGLGAKTLVANIVGSQYLKQHCRLGDEVSLGNIQGVVLEINHTSIIIESDKGRTIIPAKLFLEQVTNFSSIASGSGQHDNE